MAEVKKKKPRRFTIERVHIDPKTGERWYRSIRRKRWSLREMLRNSKGLGKEKFRRWLRACRVGSTFKDGVGGKKFLPALYLITRVR